MASAKQSLLRLLMREVGHVVAHVVHAAQQEDHLPVYNPSSTCAQLAPCSQLLTSVKVDLIMVSVTVITHCIFM